MELETHTHTPVKVFSASVRHPQAYTAHARLFYWKVARESSSMMESAMIVRLQYQHVLMATIREQKENKEIMSSTMEAPISIPSES